MIDKYLLDSNVFITPHRLYYPFDFAPGFWDQLAEKLKLDIGFIIPLISHQDFGINWRRS